ncbi:unnamed protein product [Calicophoron daubneyi]|uniref:Kinase n=1 Tax=Calicophoron daubneyi TaxID=300641 RepID=A0AAV2T9U5_CALDB
MPRARSHLLAALVQIRPHLVERGLLIGDVLHLIQRTLSMDGVSQGIQCPRLSTSSEHTSQSAQEDSKTPDPSFWRQSESALDGCFGKGSDVEHRQLRCPPTLKNTIVSSHKFETPSASEDEDSSRTVFFELPRTSCRSPLQRSAPASSSDRLSPLRRGARRLREPNLLSNHKPLVEIHSHRNLAYHTIWTVGLSKPEKNKVLFNRQRCWNFSLPRGIWPSRRKARPKSSSWVQLSGHEGSIMCTGKGSVLKRFNECEAQCLFELQKDPLRPFVPVYQGEKEINGQRFVQMQDVLYPFHSPFIMDCKIGQRTYLETEVAGKTGSNKLRPDMYRKMIAVDPNAPTDEEHQQQAVTKLRYMRWRELLSSSAALGFRVDAVKENYLIRLKRLKGALEVSDFFATHEFIGSSLLFAHDARGMVNVWMIDFGETLRLPPNIHVDHRKPWVLGNREDGYLVGVDNLIRLFQEISLECN